MSRNPSSQLVDMHVIEVGGEARAAHRNQADARSRPQMVRPHTAPHPVRAVLAGIRAVQLCTSARRLDDAQVGPVARRTDDGVTVTWIACRHRIFFPGKLSLPRLPD